MKRLKLTLPLALALFLFGCGKDAPDSNQAADSAAINNAQTNTTEAATNNNDTGKDKYDPEGDRLKEEKELFESEDANTRYAALEDASDYIALAELSTDAAGNTSLHFIKNYKGTLSTIELKAPKGMVPNREYIIFYRDTPDGTVRPTHATYGLYKVDGSDDELLRYMEKKYVPDDERSDQDDERNSSNDDTSMNENSDSMSSDSSNNSSGSDSSSSTSSKKNSSSNSSSTSKKSSSSDSQTSKREIDLEN